ncbi:phosphoribosylamine--glycine ligase [Petrotoga miotherma DSM 10691]|uniref:Phosphoribosylamine--glycine ligase n=2 Tax=Petrotoga TaxID=28236 RepID=A0A2K1PEW4_9BACT|nr:MULTISPECIES: phosphoribosylamine--glycine ligase [Petrotoga]PNS01336.1 phosphoribosylamine--glycine ligase [Petrotoga miotherma DSM 10691]POZ90809.1 phosphoribosylamine--glycine ligase [Petrotoga halophila DSM 16923]
MKVLVVGKGGREHAIAWKLSQSEDVKKVFIAPGNDGIAIENKCECLKIESIEEIMNFVKNNNVDITIVGSEEYLAKGIVDKFEESNLKIIGPNQKAAQLESSKIFAKSFMKRHNVQTASFNTFVELKDALEYSKKASYPLVIKADGLAAGKGVFICNSYEDSSQALNELMKEQKFGESGKKIVVEQFLKGFEASVFLLLDGQNYKFFNVSKDHKKLLENDQGPNTGGMGAITPHPDLDEKLTKVIFQKIINPTIKGLEEEGLLYKGFLYIGLIIENGDPHVLEYNVRLGDPEAQSMLYLLKSDFIDVINDIKKERVNTTNIEFYDGLSFCLVLSSKGYPFSYTKGERITIKPGITSKIFYSGVKKDGENLLTDGGRVLSIVNKADTLEEVRNIVYDEAEKIHFESKYYRKDI